jgi:hypothetical protein
MENQEIGTSLFDLSFTEDVKTQMRGAAVWAGVAAILSLVTAIIGAVLQFTGNSPVDKYKQTEGFNDAAKMAQTGANIFSVVISLGLTVMFFYFLNRFATLTKKGLNENNQELVSQGLGGLSAYFIAMGVIFIIVLACALFGILAVAVLLATKS